MSESTPEATPFDKVLLECLTRLENEEATDIRSLQDDFPEYATEIGEYFEAVDLVQQLAGPTRLESLGIDASIETSRLDLGAMETQPASASSSTFSEEDLPHDFGRYRITSILGHGAMGTVFRALDSRLDREVAIKIPRHEQNIGCDLRIRFEREARAVAALKHRNICPVHDIGEIDGLHYIAFSYIEGQTLAELIRDRAPLPEMEAIRIIARLSETLSYAHEQKIIHRDLKPANVMMDNENEPVIMDFGLAVQEGADSAIRITQHGTLVGTPAYMAPEQLDSAPVVPGPQIDIYALGVILYELLTGKLPFDGSLPAFVSQVLNKEAIPPSDINPTISSPINCVCMKMLEKKPSRRFRSMQDVTKALHTTEKMEVGNASGSIKWVLGSMAICIGILVTGWWLGAFGGNAMPPITNQAESEVSVRSPLAAVLERQIEGLPGPQVCIAYAPDGKSLASFQGNKKNGVPGEIRIWDSSTWEQTNVLKANVDEYMIGGFNSDGTELLSVGLDNNIILWDVPQGKELRRFTKPPGIQNFCFLSNRFACTVGEYDGKIHVWDLLRSRIAKELPRDKGGWADVNFIAQDGYLAIADSSGTIQLRDLRNSSEIKRFSLKDVPDKQFNCDSDISFDGKHVVLTWPHSMAVWDVETGDMLHRWDNLRPTCTLSFTPDGRHVVRCTYGGTIQAFEVKTGRHKVIAETRIESFRIAVSPDGKQIVCSGMSTPTGSDKRLPVLQVWRLPKMLWPNAESRPVEPASLDYLTKEELATTEPAKTEMNPSRPKADSAKSTQLAQEGYALMQLGQLQQAKKKLDQAIELDPKNYEAWFQRGWLHGLQNNTDLADQDYRRCITLLEERKKRTTHEQQRLAWAYLNNCDVLLRHRRIKDAIEMGNGAIAVAPDMPMALYNHARAHFENHNLAAAMQSLDKAIKLSPTFGKAYRVRSEIYQLLGDLDDAWQDITLAIQLDPSRDSMVLAATFANDMGNYEQSLYIVKSLLVAYPDDAQVHKIAGDSWAGLGELDTAEESYKTSIAAFENNYFARLCLAELLRHRGRKEEAQDYEKEAGQILDDFVAKNDESQLREMRGYSFRLKGDHTRALEDYLKAIELDNQNLFALAHAGLLLSAHPEEDQRDGEKASEIAQSILELTQEQGAFWLSIKAASAAENGDFELAKKWQLDALNVSPLVERAEYQERLDLYNQGTPFRLLEDDYLELLSLDEVVVPSSVGVKNFDALLNAGDSSKLDGVEIAQQRSATVLIKSKFGFGSGMILDHQGYVLTCAHVLPYAGNVSIHYEYEDEDFTKEATPVAIDHRNDLALLKFDPNPGQMLASVRLGLTNRIPVEVAAGSDAIVIGNPADGQWVLEKVVLKGSIANEKQVLGDFVKRPYIQVSANISSGCSGGPLFDEQGRVIGVVNMKSATLSQTGFAIPMERVVRFLGISKSE